ncbi:MAG: type II toxin-antitoxin system VapC family toxin [Pyrinomonadaceae bacterium]
MPFVLDASMTMSWCFADESTPYSHSVLRALLDTYAEVPALWPFEIANVLAINERKQRITATLSSEFIKTLSDLDIRVEQPNPPVDSNALLPLVRRYGLTAYDAAYLELAKRKSLPLATFDKDLLKAASLEGAVLMMQP